MVSGERDTRPTITQTGEQSEQTEGDERKDEEGVPHYTIMSRCALGTQRRDVTSRA